MKKIYLAAPVFSVFERNNNLVLAELLQSKGEYEVFLPQNVVPPKTPDGFDMHYIFEQCKLKIEKTDIVVAIVDGPDVDSGVAWELGYAYAENIPSICIRTDQRKAENKGVNIMIEYGSLKTVYFTKYHQTIEQLANSILDELEKL